MGTNADRRWSQQSKLKFASGAYDEGMNPPYVDRDKMSARFTVSTANPDRVGDVLLPSGCDITDYRKNPCWMYGHGLEGIVLPIGTCMDPDGKLDLQITEDAVTATCYFSKSLLEAEQIFELIAEGTLKACSVRETPISQKRIVKNGRQINLVDHWSLEEISVASVGVNPDAVAKALHRNRLAGKPIAQSIFKSLNAVAEPLKRPGTGFKEESMNDSNKKTDDETPADEVPGQEESETAEVEAGGGDANDKTNADNPPEQDNLYGRQLLGAAHDGLKSLRASLRSGMKCLDNKDLKADIQQHHDRLGAELPVLQGMRSEHYPESSEMKDENAEEDASGGDDEGGDDSGGESDSDSAMKSMFRSFKPAKYKALAVKSDIQSVLKSCRGLTAGERTKLRRALETQQELIAASQSEKPAVSAKKSLNTPAKNEASEAEVKALTDQIAALKKLINPAA